MDKSNTAASETKASTKHTYLPKLTAQPNAKAPIVSTEDTAAANVEFPLCDAAVRKLTYDQWELADAIVAECSDPGSDGVRNESYAKINAMREEIAQNHGIDLSFERVRKLRKAASAFPPGRRRPAVSLEGHLEAGMPDALDELVRAAPAGTAHATISGSRSIRPRRLGSRTSRRSNAIAKSRTTVRLC